jgi:hypothetical protein
MRNLKKRLVTVALTTGLALAGALGATGSAVAAESTPAHEPVVGQASVAAAGRTYMGSTRDLSACHSTGLWYVLNGYATYYSCEEYYDPNTGRWYALYVGV